MIANIQKALALKAKVDYKALLSEAYKDYAWIFNLKTAFKQAPHRPSVDHAIKLEKDEDGKKKPTL